MNVLIKRKKHALARLQLVLYASIMLSSGVNTFQERVYIDDACEQLSEDMEHEKQSTKFGWSGGSGGRCKVSVHCT